MRILWDSNDLKRIKIALEDVEALYDKLHISIRFSVVSMTEHIDDEPISVLNKELTERIRKDIYKK